MDQEDFHKHFIKRIIEGNLVLIHGHITGIEWLSNQVKQYKSEEVLVEKNIVGITLTDPRNEREYGRLLGVWVKKTDLFWEILNTYWDFEEDDRLIAVEIEPQSEETEDDITNPTEFCLYPTRCKSHTPSDREGCAEAMWKYIDTYSDWCHNNVEELYEDD